MSSPLPSLPRIDVFRFSTGLSQVHSHLQTLQLTCITTSCRTLFSISTVSKCNLQTFFSTASAYERHQMVEAPEVMFPVIAKEYVPMVAQTVISSYCSYIVYLPQ